MSSIHVDSLQDDIDWLLNDSSNNPSTQFTTTFRNDFEPESFDNYVNDASASFSESFIPPADPLADLMSPYNWMSASALPRPSMGPSSAYSTTLSSAGRSPSLTASDTTLVDLAIPSTPSDFNGTDAAVIGSPQPTMTLGWEDRLFDFDLGKVMSTPSMSYVSFTPPIETDARASLSPMGTTTCHGQPQQQHLSLGAVAAFAYDGVRMQADPSPLTAHEAVETPAPPAPSPVLSLPRSRKRSAKAAKVHDDNVIVDDKKPVKRRRRQDTTKTIPCPDCGSMWARMNNLITHIKSVHRGERSFVCSDAHCTRAFSRKHDMTRHYQSEHTTLGSPRRKDVK
ncbi:hypothetical protein GY45DRAFT_952116 [Cubamyces sp. BRFM 1775]|nr:hypothetical protein GY45DRAFT_952116 [Cubamyces sp. BRFM 1775]